MPSPRPSLFALCALLSLPVFIQAAEETAADTKKLPVIAKPRVEVSGETAHMSSSLSSRITTTLPQYTPPPAPEANTHQDPALEESAEIAETDPNDQGDQPRNKIIRLPKYVVHGERPPIFREKDLNTKAGLSKLAAKRYLSKLDRSLLNRFTIPIIGQSAEQRALAMYEEDERLQNISDLKEDANNAQRSGESAEAKALRRETDRAYIRSGGMDWTLPKD